ncbi:MAG TPA: hypothetical protein PKN63_11685 [Chitinophagales bacterium]|nr:hypothetical protein [Chitinophagales bacterium]
MDLQIGQRTTRNENKESRTANKQIGKRAGEQLRLNDSAKLNDSNSIQH